MKRSTLILISLPLLLSHVIPSKQKSVTDKYYKNKGDNAESLYRPTSDDNERTLSVEERKEDHGEDLKEGRRKLTSDAESVQRSETPDADDELELKTPSSSKEETESFRRSFKNNNKLAVSKDSKLANEDMSSENPMTGITTEKYRSAEKERTSSSEKATNEDKFGHRRHNTEDDDIKEKTDGVQLSNRRFLAPGTQDILLDHKARSGETFDEEIEGTNSKSGFLNSDDVHYFGSNKRSDPRLYNAPMSPTNLIRGAISNNLMPTQIPPFLRYNMPNKLVNQAKKYFTMPTPRQDVFNKKEESQNSYESLPHSPYEPSSQEHNGNPSSNAYPLSSLAKSPTGLIENRSNSNQFQPRTNNFLKFPQTPQNYRREDNTQYSGENIEKITDNYYKQFNPTFTLTNYYRQFYPGQRVYRRSSYSNSCSGC